MSKQDKQDNQEAVTPSFKVLVVDDNREVADSLARLICVLGHQASPAYDGPSALEKAAAESPDAVFLDIGMPNVDGYELLRRVRALGQAAGGGVPAVALTAFARSEDRTRALRAGFLVHVSKPVEPSELIATVASVAGRV